MIAMQTVSSKVTLVLDFFNQKKIKISNLMSKIYRSRVYRHIFSKTHGINFKPIIDIKILFNNVIQNFILWSERKVKIGKKKQFPLSRSPSLQSLWRKYGNVSFYRINNSVKAGVKLNIHYKNVAEIFMKLFHSLFYLLLVNVFPCV